MNSSPDQPGEIFNPFPGLRPFKQDEAHLFFGREGQSQSVLKSLYTHNFVAVTGASGSGKSSLIYCGVIPELRSQHGKDWKVVSARPGTHPVSNMLNVFSNIFKGRVDDGDAKKLIEGGLSFREWLKRVLKKDEKLLLVVDQFEEIFRFRRIGSTEQTAMEAERFVAMIYEACADPASMVKVVITMRSDFIGECSVFQDLTELINLSNYLIPQMTRQDFRKAIEGPVSVGGAGIEPELVEQLLDELGDDTDQLPVLQHAMMRTWEYWQLQNDLAKLISVGDYEAVGRMEKALSDHANEAYDELDEQQRIICERLFKTITEKGGDNRGVRRPAAIKRIAEISRCRSEEIIHIAEVFRSGSRTFLTPYQPVELTIDTVIDISHESLMRIWDRLRLWVDEEAASVHMYKRLSEAAALYQQGTAGLWRPPDLQLALNWRDKQNPTPTWAVQYDPAFERAMVFLDKSELEYRKEEENKIRLQKRRLRVTRMFSLVLGGIAVIAMGLFLYTRDLSAKAEAERIKAEVERANAEESARQARIAQDEALDAKVQADDAREKAEDALELAEQRRIEAENASDLAVRRQRQADRSAKEALVAQAQAQKNSELAEQQRKLAVEASEEAQSRRMLSIAKSMAVKSLQIDRDDDPDLKGLLALQAFLYNESFNGPEHEADIYAGLYAARKALFGENYNVYGGHSQSVKAIEFIPGSQRFVSGGTDGRIIIRSLGDPSSSSQVLVEEEMLLEALAISADGKYLASGTSSEGIHLYNISDTESTPIVLFGHDGRIRDVEFAPDPDVLYSIGIDRTILKWTISDQTPEEVASSATRFNDICLSPDGRTLAASNRMGHILLIDLEDPSDPDTIKGTVLNPVISLDFSDDGSYLAAGDQRGNVRLFEAGSWNLMTSLRGSSARIEAVRFSPEGNYLASSSYDGKVLLWDMNSLNNSPVTMVDNRGFVFTVAFDPRENYLLSGSNTMRARPVRASMLTEDFCTGIRRNFSKEEWETYVGEDITYKKTCQELQ